jgi:ssDNA-binding Zn-finger/Zn-ribbon topoisomerase 1
MPDDDIRTCPKCGCQQLRVVMGRIGGQTIIYRECPDCGFTNKPKRERE